MKRTEPISRRVMLRGMGATLCLPLLESFGRSRALAASKTVASPRRVMFLSYAFGVSRDDWFPKDEGADNTMTKCLKPMERHRKDFSVLSHLTNKEARGSHWGCTTWLTSADVASTPGKQFQNSVSVDQVAAKQLGNDTRFQSLELAAPSEYGHGPGLSMSWSETGNPIAGESSPLALFNRLFGAAEVPLEERKYLLDRNRSVLDAVMIDAKSMNRKLSRADREKVEEYFQSVRDIEKRLNKAELWLDRPKPKAPLESPSGQLTATEEIKLMYDLMIAAIQTDQSRVFSYRQPVQSLYQTLGFKVNAHQVTHCRTSSSSYRASIVRDTKQIELLAYLIDRLKALKDPDGTSVFDNTLIVYGSGIRVAHELYDTPTLVAGHGGGGMKQGRHYVYESNQTPLANLWLSMLNQLGIQADRFADSDGKLTGLFG